MDETNTTNDIETAVDPADRFSRHVRYNLQDSGSAYEARGLALYPCPYGEPDRAIIYGIAPTPDGKQILFRPVNPEDQGMQTTGADFVGRLLEDKILVRCDELGYLAPEDIRFAPVLPLPAKESGGPLEALEEITDTLPDGAPPAAEETPAEEPHTEG